MPIPVALLASAPSVLRRIGLGGHRDVAGERDPNVPKIRASTNADALRIIATWGVLPAPMARELFRINAPVNFGDGKAGRDYESQVARETLEQLTLGIGRTGGGGGGAAGGAGGSPRNPLIAAVEDAAGAAARAAGASLGQDVRTIGAGAADQFGRTIERGTGADVRYWGLTTMQWVLVGVVGLLGVFLLLRSK
jgi:hypothetical protein